VPAHHDDWAAGITTKGENYRAPFEAELARMPPEERPSVRFIADPTDYVRPEVLTFPVRIAPVRLARRCAGGGGLRVRLRGDLADVTGAEVRLGRSRRSLVPDGAVTFGRRAVRRGARLVARVTEVDRGVRTLRRSLPRCVRR
jgi:hypothetical protein